MAKEWGQWLKYGAVEKLPDDYIPKEGENVLDMRAMATDKQETARGPRSSEKLPLETKMGIVVQRPKQALSLTEQRDTSSPTLPEDGLHIFLNDN